MIIRRSARLGGVSALVPSFLVVTSPGGSAITFGELLRDRWDALYADWLGPAKDVALPWLAGLLFLLVLSRLATPVIVHPDAGKYRRWRPLAWWGGVVMLAAASAVPVVVSYARAEVSGPWVGDVDPSWLAIVVLVGGLLLAFGFELARAPATEPERSLESRRRVRRVVRRRGLALGTALVSTAVAAVLAAGGRTWSGVSLQWGTGVLWVLGGVLAVVGIVWLAAGRGKKLRIRVEVRNDEGQTDANAAHYLVARLQDLGSTRPRGLEEPQQTDVTKLPEALTTLPKGDVATAIFGVLQAVRSAVPWRCTVSVLGGDTAAITVARNGRTVDGTERIDLDELIPCASAEGDTEADRKAELLTAAAAFLLTSLSTRHPELRRGLCGATRWQSVAQHAIATAPPTDRDDTKKRQLLGAAVDADPRNRLAQLALLIGEHRKNDDLAAGHALADGLREQLRYIERRLPNEKEGPSMRKEFERARPAAGEGALQLRLLKLRAAVGLNIHLLGEQSPDVSAWREAGDACRWLIRRLSVIETSAPEDEDSELGELAEGLRLPACFLWDGVVDSNPGQKLPDQHEISHITERWKKTAYMSRSAHYHLACFLASKRETSREELTRALDHLEKAVTGDVQGKYAPYVASDPSFKVFRDTADTELGARYGKLAKNPDGAEVS